MMSNEATTIKPLLFQGTLLNTQGNAIPAAKIQLWQTDLNGNYLHTHSGAALSPYSQEYASIVSNFQYFGTDETDANGNFEFLTYRPGIYGYRPSHFHMKVWLDDPNTGEDTLGLITQFYFRDEASSFPEELQLDVTEIDDTTYKYGSYVNGTIVIGDGLSSSTGEELLPVTPKQAEGPYYPEVDFFSMDNDLTTANDIVTDADASTDPTVGTDVISTYYQPYIISFAHFSECCWYRVTIFWNVAASTDSLKLCSIERRLYQWACWVWVDDILLSLSKRYVIGMQSRRKKDVKLLWCMGSKAP